jgi:2-succinyl-5-enolpyruvyl-6-hydroxy-3-cyclohexene-1-carboxylate synthase
VTPKNLSAEWSRLLAATLADAGVTDVIVSPGSRTTPFLLAILDEARLQVHDVIDERVAGFMALGMARVTGRPAALLCTSGTALAHYLPAVIEASESGIPLLVMSADRPPEVVDAAANQTIRQRGLYDGFVRWAADLGLPESHEAALRSLRRRVTRAVRESMRDKPGPVHLNLPARKPLEPVVDAAPEGRDLTSRARALAAEPIAFTAPARRVPAPAEQAQWLTGLRAAAGHGIIACGPGLDAATRGAVVDFARATGFPVLAESASGLRFAPMPNEVVRIGAVDALLRAGMGTTRHQPTMIVQFGRPLVCGAWDRLASVPGCRWVVAGRDWPDPDGTARLVSEADAALLVQALVADGHPQTFARDPAFAAAWAQADRRVFAAAGAIIDAGGDPLSEAAALRALVDTTPANGILVLGNSLPVRAIDAWVPPGVRPIDVLSQRGVSGIDGLVSGAAGAWRAARRPTVLVLGDVSLVHDLTGLQALGTSGPACVILVLDNQGGRIFEQLPVAREQPQAMAHFFTTPRVRFAAAAATFGLPHAAVDGVAGLRGALTAAFARPGASLVQAIVPPHGAAEDAVRLAAATVTALEAE